MKNSITEILESVQTVAIAGHVRPDGDCIGSCMGMYLYLKENYPNIQTDVYLEPVPEGFSYIQDLDQAKTVCDNEKKYDVFFIFDVGEKARIGVASDLMDTAARTVCIDHHITNTGTADNNQIVPDASSTCEVLYELLEEEKISKSVAEALYTGIVHDTGVFQYSNTGKRTMEIAGILMEKGVDFTSIIRDSFYAKTYAENQIMGRTVMESMLILEGKCIIGYLKKKTLEFYGVTSKDLNGIVNQLLNTRGVEVAVFLYETGVQEYKVSMRSKNIVNVAAIASVFGGGGHVKAAGCNMQGSVHDVINSVTMYIEKQLQGYENGH